MAALAVLLFNDAATTEICSLSLHDALPILAVPSAVLTSTVRSWLAALVQGTVKVTWPLASEALALAMDSVAVSSFWVVPVAVPAPLASRAGRPVPLKRRLPEAAADVLLSPP